MTFGATDRQHARRWRSGGGPAAVAALCAASAMLLAAEPARASAVDLLFDVGREEGAFLGDETVDLDHASIGAEFGGPSSRLVFTVPYVGFNRTGLVTFTPDGPAVIGAGGPGKPPWQDRDPDSSSNGLGDILITSKNYIMKSGAGNRPTLTFDVDYKWATADESKGLGTGENDWGGGFDYTQPIGKHFQILGRAHYQFSGSPEGVTFEDRLYLRGGFGFLTAHTAWRLHYETVDPLMKVVPLYDASGAATALVEVQRYEAVRGEAVFRNQAGGSWRIWALAGLNDSSPDLGFGLTFASRAL